MAIGSVLSPEKIVGKQNKNQQLARNFIFGGSDFGASSIASAANKIVAFQKGTAKPVASEVGSIVDTISTNITNNITNNLNTTLQSFTADYKKRINDIDSAKPIGILNKFLSTYKNVIQFIQFFANKKFINGISDNLKSLSKSFTESFEVAKLIRQVIVKIVEQLSNLPKATPGGGGGIDIDVDVPMGGVRKSAPRGLSNMFKGRGKMLALGAGALGLGAAGAGAVNALSNVDEIRAGMFQPGDSGDIISTFGSAIERFIAAINTMVGIKKDSTPSGSADGGGGGGSMSPGGPGPGGPGPDGGIPPYTGNAPVTDVSKDTEFLEEVRKLAAETGAKPSELLALYQAESGIRPNAKNPSGATGIFQLMFDPNNPDDKRYGKTREEFASMSRADQVRAHRKYLEEVGFFKGGYKGLTNLKVANIGPAFLGKSLDEPMYRQGTSAYERNKNIDLIYGNSDGVITANEYNNFVMVRGNPTAFEKYDIPSSQLGQGGPDLADWRLPPEKRDQYKNLATNVSQVAQTAAQSQTNILPIDLSGAMPQQSQGGGGVSAPPSTNTRGPSVPLLPSTNTDNFLVLYSRMVYNIVDG